MGIALLLAMIVVPIVEIAVFIGVGGYLGLWPTIAIVVLTAIAGAGLLRYQGLATLFRASEILAQGRFPMSEVFDGLCLLVAGALLLTPGFVTDGVGLLLFVPGFRAVLGQAAGRYLAASGKIHVRTDGPASPSRRDTGEAPVIEGDFDDVTPEEDRRRR